MNGSPLPAGKYRVGVKVRLANDEYPGELVTDYEVIEVVPFYRHAIEPLDPDQCGALKDGEEV